MPLYEYACKRCDHTFETLVFEYLAQQFSRLIARFHNVCNQGDVFEY